LRIEVVGMKRVSAILLALVGLALLLALPTSAQTIRCGTEIVRVGDPTIKLLQKCGEPDLKELIKTNGLIIEKWTYNCGSARFMKILTLKGGKVQRVEVADYGTGPARCQ
jgi:hypothetical protein